MLRSLIVLKALTYGPTGGIVAAATTSLPEQLAGARAWDYRYCWIRDSTLTLDALACSSFLAEARARLAAARGRGGASQLQLMYSVTGERHLPESELPWLSGYQDSRPVRIGNAAHGQLQLDVFGEIMDSFHLDRVHGLKSLDEAWRVQLVLLDALEAAWQQPDSGIWEVRGAPRHFTHSKVMAWVAFDRAVKAVESYRREGPVARWQCLRDQIHNDVCTAASRSRSSPFFDRPPRRSSTSNIPTCRAIRASPPTHARVDQITPASPRFLEVSSSAANPVRTLVALALRLSRHFG